MVVGLRREDDVRADDNGVCPAARQPQDHGDRELERGAADEQHLEAAEIHLAAEHGAPELGGPVQCKPEGRQMQERSDGPVARREPAEASEPVAREHQRHLDVQSRRPVERPIGLLPVWKLQGLGREAAGIAKQ